MQGLFGRILASAARRNRPYSPRLLSFLQMMDAVEMDAIVAVAPFIFSHKRNNGEIECNLITSWGKNEGEISKKMYDLIGNHKSDILIPLGIYVSGGWAHCLVMTDKTQRVQFKFNGTILGAKPSDQLEDVYFENDYLILGSGYKVTQLGAELFELCSPSKSTKQYVELLTQQMSEMGFKEFTLQQTGKVD